MKVTLRFEREDRWPEQPQFMRSAMGWTSAAVGPVVEQKVTLLPGQMLKLTLRFT